MLTKTAKKNNSNDESEHEDVCGDDRQNQRIRENTYFEFRFCYKNILFRTYLKNSIILIIKYCYNQ